MMQPVLCSARAFIRSLEADQQERARTDAFAMLRPLGEPQRTAARPHSPACFATGVNVLCIPPFVEDQVQRWLDAGAMMLMCTI